MSMGASPSPAASGTLDDTVDTCVNTKGIELIKPNKVSIPSTYTLKVWKKGFPIMHDIDDSRIHLVLVRNSGEVLRYNIYSYRSIPGLLGTDYGNFDVEVNIHELSETIPTMVFTCAEPFRRMTKHDTMMKKKDIFT